MPCYDDRWEMQTKETAERAAFAEAALCAVLRAATAQGVFADFMAAVDWERAGITPHQMRAWWQRHLEADARRERQEGKKA